MHTSEMKALAPLLALVLAGCGGAAATEPEPVSEIDTIDRCTAIPPWCIEGWQPGDDDGCPDPPTPQIGFAPGDATLDEAAQRTLEELGSDGRRLWPGATLRLVAVHAEGEDAALGGARIEAVRAGLIARGVPEERIREGGTVPEGRAERAVRVAVDGCAL